MFEQHYEPVSKDSADSGQIALVPWDIETFGFGVADYQLDKLQQDPLQLKEHIEAWAKTHQVELVGTTVPASDGAKLHLLQSVGFRYVDTTLVVCYENVRNIECPAVKGTFSQAKKDELDAVIEICGQAFNHGRYHADPRFPKNLANKRYQQWASRTSDPQNPQVLFVLKMESHLCAFSIVQVDGKNGYLHLNAVANQWRGKGIGKNLIRSTIRYFQQQGVSSVRSKISAANTPAANLHASLGAKFYDTTILLHWHAPWAAHLAKTPQRGKL